HREVADQAAARGARLRPEFLDRSKQALAGLIDQLPLLGQAEAGPATLAEPQAEPMLQRGHVRADGRLADIELNLRSGKAAGFHDFRENTQQSKVALAQVRKHAVPTSAAASRRHPDVCPCAPQDFIVMCQTGERLTPARRPRGAGDRAEHGRGWNAATDPRAVEPATRPGSGSPGWRPGP